MSATVSVGLCCCFRRLFALHITGQPALLRGGCWVDMVRPGAAVLAGVGPARVSVGPVVRWFEGLLGCARDVFRRRHLPALLWLVWGVVGAEGPHLRRSRMDASSLSAALRRR